MSYARRRFAIREHQDAVQVFEIIGSEKVPFSHIMGDLSAEAVTIYLAINYPGSHIDHEDLHDE